MLTPEQIAGITGIAQHYIDNARRYEADMKRIA
jgi:hypothetical protein